MDQTAAAPATAIDPGTLGAAEWVQLVFGFLWRGIAYTIVCVIVGGIVGGIAGGIIGVVMGMGGYDIASIQRISGWVGGALGFGIGLVGMKFYIQWLLRARFGALRLSLVRADPA
jgi:integral membrane sensor domain MASE1